MAKSMVPELSRWDTLPSGTPWIHWAVVVMTVFILGLLEVFKFLGSGSCTWQVLNKCLFLLAMNAC